MERFGNQRLPAEIRREYVLTVRSAAVIGAHAVQPARYPRGRVALAECKVHIVEL
jgi:hypothetical protein